MGPGISYRKLFYLCHENHKCFINTLKIKLKENRNGCKYLVKFLFYAFLFVLKLNIKFINLISPFLSFLWIHRRIYLKNIRLFSKKSNITKEVKIISSEKVLIPQLSDHAPKCHKIPHNYQKNADLRLFRSSPFANFFINSFLVSVYPLYVKISYASFCVHQKAMIWT